MNFEKVSIIATTMANVPKEHKLHFIKYAAEEVPFYSKKSLVTMSKDEFIEKIAEPLKRKVILLPEPIESIDELINIMYDILEAAEVKSVKNLAIQFYNYIYLFFFERVDEKMNEVTGMWVDRILYQKDNKVQYTVSYKIAGERDSEVVSALVQNYVVNRNCGKLETLEDDFDKYGTLIQYEKENIVYDKQQELIDFYDKNGYIQPPEIHICLNVAGGTQVDYINGKIMDFTQYKIKSIKQIDYPAFDIGVDSLEINYGDEVELTCILPNENIEGNIFQFDIELEGTVNKQDIETFIYLLKTKYYALAYYDEIDEFPVYIWIPIQYESANRCITIDTIACWNEFKSISSVMLNKKDKEVRIIINK